MKILVLGGYGKVGEEAIKILAKSNLVTSITIAGRNLKKAEETAKKLSVKAEGIEIDGTNQQDLTSILKDYDLVVNAAFDDTVLPTINAAIAAKTNYCDANIGYIKQAKMLSLQAETAGITSIIANGVSPCISNIMGIHISRQLDDIEQMYIGRADAFILTRPKLPWMTASLLRPPAKEMPISAVWLLPIVIPHPLRL